MIVTLLALLALAGFFRGHEPVASPCSGTSRQDHHPFDDARDRGIGEWGFAALLEVDGRVFLFDTGARPETVLLNSQELGVIDLSPVTESC